MDSVRFLYIKKTSENVAQKFNSFQFILPRKYNSSMNLLYLVLNLLSAPNQLLISPQTYSTFLNFCLIFLMLSPKFLFLSLPLKIPFIFHAHLKNHLCIQILHIPMILYGTLLMYLPWYSLFCIVMQLFVNLL